MRSYDRASTFPSGPPRAKDWNWMTSSWERKEIVKQSLFPGIRTRQKKRFFRCDAIVRRERVSVRNKMKMKITLLRHSSTAAIRLSLSWSASSTISEGRQFWKIIRQFEAESDTFLHVREWMREAERKEGRKAKESEGRSLKSQCSLALSDGRESVAIAESEANDRNRRKMAEAQCVVNMSVQCGPVSFYFIQSLIAQIDERESSNCIDRDSSCAPLGYLARKSVEVSSRELWEGLWSVNRNISNSGHNDNNNLLIYLSSPLTIQIDCALVVNDRATDNLAQRSLSECLHLPFSFQSGNRNNDLHR